MAPTAMVPWATLPRRNNSHDVDTFPTTANDPSDLVLTNSSNRSTDQLQIPLTKSAIPQLTAVQQQQQQSPTLQRQQRQRNVVQHGSPRLIRSPQKLPVKVSPPRSPITFSDCQTVTECGSTTSPVLSTNNSCSNSNTVTTNVITDISNNRRISSITNSVTGNTNTATVVPVQADFSNVKQVSFRFFSPSPSLLSEY